jgi:hypothetical protein
MPNWPPERSRDAKIELACYSRREKRGELSPAPGRRQTNIRSSHIQDLIGE